MKVRDKVRKRISAQQKKRRSAKPKTTDARDPYGKTNPQESSYVAELIAEVDRRLNSPKYDMDLQPLKRKRKKRNG